jgi:hypothetical protein
MSLADSQGMRTTIRMNEELARRAKAYAIRNNRTFTQVVEEAVARMLAGQESQTPAKRFTLPPAVGSPKHQMTEEQYRAILEGMYEEEAERIARPADGKGHARTRR